MSIGVIGVEQKYVTILGSTGSIGLSALEVIRRHPERYKVYALTANSNIQLLIDLCLTYTPVYAVVLDYPAQQLVVSALRNSGLSTQVLLGAEALSEVATHEPVSIVIAGIMGSAGLLSTLSAVKAGKRVLLANKEALVMAGKIMIDAAYKSGAQLLPIDSEHNAIFQCLPIDVDRVKFPFNKDSCRSFGVKKIVLTASGGPFLGRDFESFESVTPEEACAHPNWRMGRKISVDSATMMNKGLELIEACWLFSVEPKNIEVVIHPQSIIHSMVEYLDGSFIAQMGCPDMKTPIAHALAWPERITSGVKSIDWFSVGGLTFLPPDEEKCLCLKLAREAQSYGGNATIYLNAANEVAVSAFLEKKIRFTQIPTIIGKVLEKAACEPVTTLEEVLNHDAFARAHTLHLI